MLFSDEKLLKYTEEHTSPVDTILEELIRETNLKTVNPRMLSGAYQGKFLEMISSVIRPLNVLEIGTFTGFSAICLAKGLRENGMVHTIDYNDEITGFAVKYIEKAGLTDKIKVYTGDALKIIPGLNIDLDLVFIDGEKTEYCDYYRLAFPKVKRGGIILADNVLWSGKVIENISGGDLDTAGIIEFNQMIQKDSRVENFLLPIRDGIMMIRKISD